jgi:CTP synthase
LKEWKAMTEKCRLAKKEVDIGIVGKYFISGQFCFTDSYVSVIEAIKHAATFNGCKANLHWLSAEDVEKDGVSSLKKYDGIIVPQGWGSRGSEGKSER